MTGHSRPYDRRIVVGGLHQHAADGPGDARFDRLPDLFGLSDDAIIAATAPLDDVGTHQFAIIANGATMRTSCNGVTAMP